MRRKKKLNRIIKGIGCRLFFPFSPPLPLYNKEFERKNLINQRIFLFSRNATLRYGEFHFSLYGADVASKHLFLCRYLGF